MGWHRWDGRRWAVVRPKTPRGTRTSPLREREEPPRRQSRQTQNPRGDENRLPLETSGRTRSRRSCRQTQNPARGREHALLLHCANEKSRRVVRTRTLSVSASIRVVRSSDPKPREGTRTGEMRAAGPAELGSSDPKPREGTKPEGASTKVCVRWSSDPKPREGTRTCGGTASRGCPRWSRQTQNPARGRELNAQLGGHVNEVGVSSGQNPARDENPRYREHLPTRSGCRQTQNPARGRELVLLLAGQCLRRLPESSDPKPPRGTRTRPKSPTSGCDRISRQTQNPARGREPTSW